MARITSLGRRAARIVSLRRSAAKARRGEPDPSASGPWARAHLDGGSGLLSIVLESTEPTQVRLRQSVASLTAQLDRVDARTPCCQQNARTLNPLACQRVIRSRHCRSRSGSLCLRPMLCSLMDFHQG